MSSEENSKAEDSANESVEESAGSVEEPTVTEETAEEEPKANKTNEPRLARVEYDYEAREPDELSLNVNDVITVLEQGEGWWKGDLNGKIGTFPANHVKLIEVPNQSLEDDEDENSEGRKKKTLNKYGVKPGGLGSLFSGGIPGGIPALKKRSQPIPETSPEEKFTIASPPVLKKTSVPSPGKQQPSPSLPNLPPKKKPSKPKKAEPKAEVMFPHEAEGDDEISLVEGTFVTILEKVDEDGWWRGRNEQGQVGLFPSTYVKEIKQQQTPEEVIESNAEKSEPREPSEISATTVQAEIFTSEPAPVDSPPSSIHSSSQNTYEAHDEDSPTLPKSPPPPMKRTTNETSSPPTPNRRSTLESSQAASPQRRSTYESTSPTLPRRNSSQDGEESRRSSSVDSPDSPIQPISPKNNSVDNTPTSPEERPIAPPRPSSLYENKTDSQKSPTLAKPPNVPKSFSPAKPPVVSPIRRSSSKSVSESTSTEPVSPKIKRRTSQDQYDSSTAPESENKDDSTVENVEQVDEVAEKHGETLVDKIDDNKEAEVSEEEEAKDDEKVITETAETKEGEDATEGHEVEPEETKPRLPPLPSGPKLSNLGKDRPAIRNRKSPSVKNAKEAASQSQTAILLEAVESAKDEDEPKSQPVASPPTPPKPEKPEKPIKPNTFKLPTLGVGVQLRHVAKKPIETSTESKETTPSATSSGIDTKPISGGVKGISSRFNQFGGIPNSSDVEFRLKKWFNEEINKVKSNFETQLAEERSKREALEEKFEELISNLQE